ncbi:hypothetical protein PQX77_015580 [Marasmius sp. AFHP31]|nr:hypothetical protein PQX77_015580 [Marasmius sp. AFHP31]
MTPGTERKSLEESLESILADKSKLQDLLAKEGYPTQQWLDLMQQLVDSPHLSAELRPAIFSAMLQLSKLSGLHPACLSIQNVKKVGKRPVAAGGFGDVWKGAIGDSNELVCLKVVRVYLSSDLQELSTEYLREAILWRQMKHPNLLPFIGIYRLEDAQELCLISPWMEKGNLVEFMKATKREDIDHYRLFFKVYDVASGLAYLHAKKIVHGDLKGVNVLITCSLRACIADFGLSRIADTHGLGVTTSATRPAGTMRWLAPELLSGGERPSKKSDVYSFACVCYEIFTGLRPFAELTNDMAVMFAVAQGDRPSRPQETFGLSDTMWILMTQCWMRAPSSRPTAGWVLENVGKMASKASDSTAADWNDSLLTHVRENVVCPLITSEFSNSHQSGAIASFSGLLKALLSPTKSQGPAVTDQSHGHWHPPPEPEHDDSYVTRASSASLNYLSPTFQSHSTLFDQRISKPLGHFMVGGEPKNASRVFTNHYHTIIQANPQGNIWGILSGIGAHHKAEHQFSREIRGQFPPGIRTMALNMIYDWWSTRQQDQPICWLSGAAGVGKSAIAMTVAQACESSKSLVSSFFFFRSDPKRNNPSALWLTIAHGLTLTLPPLNNFIEERILKDPTILDASLEHQFHDLILNPAPDWSWPRGLWGFVSDLADVLPVPTVIIIDGLDECGDEETQLRILFTIQSAYERVPHFPLRFLICSRPEAWIQEAFADNPLLHLSKKIALDNPLVQYH